MTRFLVLLSCVSVMLTAAEEKSAPIMPSEVTLTTGRVLRNVTVVRWEANRVVLKHSAGADPLAFSLFKSPSPAELPAIRDASITLMKKAESEKQKVVAEANAPKKYEGQVFIVTRGAGNYKIGGTTLRIFHKTKSEILDAYKWSSESPSPNDICVTDAEGKFSFSGPPSGPITIVAKDRRLVGGQYESYFWVVSVDEMANRFQPLLTNGNMERGPIIQSKAYESL